MTARRLDFTRWTPRHTFFAAFASLALLTTPLSSARAEEYSTLGEGAAALVEDVWDAPGAGVDFMEYVYPGQYIDLRPAGGLVLFYFDSCLEETIRDGELYVQSESSDVIGGRVDVSRVDCWDSNASITEETGEAGATVDRKAAPY